MTISGDQTLKRMGEVDLIKFICSILIVYYHLTPRLAAKFPDVELYTLMTQRNGAAGGVGVLCFFILSGAFFQLGHDWNKMSCTDFIIKKVARLWPALVFSVLVNYHTKTDILNLFFINCGIGVITKGASNPASWYVCVLFWLLLIYFLWFSKSPPPPPHTHTAIPFWFWL